MIGIPNFDPDTGIHYGVINMNTPMPEAVTDTLDSIHTIDVRFESAEEEIDKAIDELMDATFDFHGGDQQLRDDIKYRMMELLEDFQGDIHRYEMDGYLILLYTDSNVIMVIKSPYYTMAHECSPCYPNAGDLNTPGELKTYCLGTDFFEDEKAPYEIYAVE
jgi:hypothetical protein